MCRKHISEKYETMEYFYGLTEHILNFEKGMISQVPVFGMFGLYIKYPPQAQVFILRDCGTFGRWGINGGSRALVSGSGVYNPTLME